MATILIEVTEDDTNELQRYASFQILDISVILDRIDAGDTLSGPKFAKRSTYERLMEFWSRILEATHHPQ